MQETVYFKNAKMQKLAGIIDRDDNLLTQPAIIIFSAFNSYKNSNVQEELAMFFNSLGFATFRFDYSGRGESEGNIEYATFSSGLDDTKSALEFIKNQLWSDLNDIGIYSFGIGAAYAVSQVTKKKGLKFLIMTNPRLKIQSFYKGADIDAWRKNEFYYTRGMNHHISIYDDAEKYDVLKKCEKISIPTLIINTTGEETYKLKCHSQIKKAIKHADVEIIKSESRVYSSDNKERLNSVLESWLEKNG